MIYIYIYIYIYCIIILYTLPPKRIINQEWFCSHCSRLVCSQNLLDWPTWNLQTWTQFPWISHMKNRWYRFMDVPFHIFPGFPWSTHVNLHRLLKSGVPDLASIDVTPILWTFWTLNLEAWINEGWCEWWFHGDFIVISWGFNGI